MNNYGACNLIAQSDGYDFKLRPLIIQNLSYDLILGMDAINSISYDKNQHHAIINGHKINRYLPGHQYFEGKFINNITVPPSLDTRIRVKNPIYGYNCELVEVEPTAKVLSRSSNELLVNNSIHRNEPEIIISITNFGAKNINVTKRERLFVIKPVYQQVKSVNISNLSITLCVLWFPLPSAQCMVGYPSAQSEHPHALVWHTIYILI